MKKAANIAHFILFFSCILFFTQCKTVTPKELQPKTNLANTNWKITKVFSVGKEWKPKNEYSVKFSEKGVNIHFEKNSCSGSCSYKANQIVFNQNGMACTEICCDSEEAQKLYFVFKGTMQYAFEGETLIVFDKMFRLYLAPAKADAPIVDKAIDASSLWGKSYQIYDVSDNKKGVAMGMSTPYIVSFEKSAFKIKLDVNTCTTTATYAAAKIDISATMGCTKACCDTQTAKELTDYFKGAFTCAQSGEYLKMSSEGIVIRLKPMEQ